MEEEIKELVDKIVEIKCFDNREEREKCIFEGKVIGVQTNDAQTEDKLSLVMDTGYQIDLIFKEGE
ncbi:unnamed protein product [marine sediment metagenome]|uniref:Uncharacterized protein n=1 Tax=marine sediment metagenome TaxID=412755 RepID=X1IRS8_9ZZZZ